MTKKDYELIAGAICTVSQNTKDQTINVEARAGYWLALEQLSRILANEFAADNPRFDRERFMRACGI